jgi:cytochrome c-type biogenesis protein CcmE
MHKKTKLRLYKFSAIAICIIIGVVIILSSLKENIIFFYTPSDIKGKNTGTQARVGGIVKKGSISIIENKNTFTLTDGASEIKVHFNGTLPMLFREEQGIVAQGIVRSDGTFEANEILAKHDEKYIPRELADDLKKKGYWKGNSNNTILHLK